MAQRNTEEDCKELVQTSSLLCFDICRQTQTIANYFVHQDEFLQTKRSYTYTYRKNKRGTIQIFELKIIIVFGAFGHFNHFITISRLPAFLRQ